jgi:ABC-type glycerol-3-phosphate transport system permease component
MLERMIIDISKWLIIILIFFIAFACSLFLIFSYFAISLNQRNTLMESSNIDTISSQAFIIPFENSSMQSRNARCPNYFYELINETRIPASTDAENNDDYDQHGSFCELSSQYDKVKNIGSFPAIHYFGKAFGSTILTIFFTLFGVIAEDNVPVSS